MHLNFIEALPWLWTMNIKLKLWRGRLTCRKNSSPKKTLIRFLAQIVHLKKACVCHFLFLVKWYPFKNYEKFYFITHFAWYIKKERRHDIETLSVDRVLEKEHFVTGSCKKCAPKTIPRLFLILLNNSKQPLCARNSFKIKIFWNRIIKKP